MSRQKAPLENLKILRDELKQRNWAVEAFLFQYKKQEFIVLVKVYSDEEKKESKYAIVKLEFIKRGDRKESFCTYADLYKIYIPNMKLFREFFGIEYADNLGDIIQQFTQYFSTFIPNKLTGNKAALLMNAITEYLNKTDSDSSKGTYCFGLKRNGIKKDGTAKQRSSENNQKAALLKPQLFKLIKDNTISFCFSEDPKRESTDDEILQRFAQRNSSMKLTL
ncbi:DUF6037 family protein [Fictibacillus fluitans]|uniref:DUF6037 family protein n=1 Tax=Fictibacillus fluitans TaxID=3058422 RepID=A0ABT8I053_9BACL|nr:DUF6037 family protein [Fictibacillus sp. NE201]MDN4526417.1 DUF6037 family protein [Fictibacillus sp. NE201]